MTKPDRFSKFLNKLRGTETPVDCSEFTPLLCRIEQTAKSLSCKPDTCIQEGFQAIKLKLKETGESNEIIVEAFATVSEAVHRTLGMKLFQGQMVSALALHRGFLVQMSTGEGKTLSAVPPTCLTALHGEGCHVLTFNDYLAGRDAEWMGPVYRFLGLSVEAVQKHMSPEQKRKAYSAQVTYATAREAGFDFLRDCLANTPQDLVQRPFRKAIVDEADSILIDGARIPLVIAGDLPRSQTDPLRTASLVKDLHEQIHWKRGHNCRNAYFTDEGYLLLEKNLGRKDLHSEENSILLSELNNALHALALLEKNVDYLVRDQSIQLIDGFTGRVAPDRRWPDGLQRALEAKEGVPVQPGGKILGSIPVQYFLGLYPELAGMTATAATSHQEFMSFYGLDLLTVPPEKERNRSDEEDRLFTHREAKNSALVKEIKREHQKERPVLVGTGSVEESEHLAALLTAASIECSVLNARNDMNEALTIADAGIPGAVTISTNMAGRGTDIRLGGSDESKREKVMALGGLYVIGTNRHESIRIDNQLRGRAGRQGDPGLSRFFVSLEDDLLTRFGIKQLIPAKLWPEKQSAPLKSSFIRREINRLQVIVEEQNFEIRKTLREYSDVIELQRQKLHQIRNSILLDGILPEEYCRGTGSHRKQLMNSGRDSTEIEKRILLHNIDRKWADHLAFAGHLQDGIHLVAVGGLNPLQHFQNTVCLEFQKLLQNIFRDSREMFTSMKTREDLNRLAKDVLRKPGATWTYLVNDRGLDDLDHIFLAGSNSPFTAAAVMTTWPLLLAGVIRRWMKGRSPGNKS